jgi:hypothetical protein
MKLEVFTGKGIAATAYQESVHSKWIVSWEVFSIQNFRGELSGIRYSARKLSRPQ